MNDVSENTFPVGTVLGDKGVVLELLGRGGMGEVYRVHQLNLKRDVAVKVISAKFLEEIDDDDYEAEACAERFSREVQVMAQVRHPNVLQIFDYGSLSVKRGEKNIPLQYITMEYVPGGTLRSTMSDEGFQPEEDRMKDWLRAYFLPLLDGVRALHEAGILHRDLKPENVLLDGNIPKIADFGLARSCRSTPFTQSMDMRGTPPYMSPEHFLDLKRTDPRTDVYALGKILYEAAAGKMGPDQIPFKQARLKDPETPFYQNLDRVIQDATADDRSERLASVDALKQALQELLGESGSKRVPAAADSGVGQQRVRRAWPVVLALVIVISLITGLGVMYFHKRGYVPPNSSEPAKLSALGQTNRSKQGKVAVSGPQGSAPARVLQGKDEAVLHLIPAGTVTLPGGLNSAQGRTAKVDSFYLDETQITNQQYVHFLNRVLARIKVQDGVVRGDKDRPWLLLGEVIPGYEPIVYRNGRFHVKNAAHAACPILRVSGYGALAYAHYYGERLMTDAEWLLALQGGGVARQESAPAGGQSPGGNDSMSMHGMMMSPSQPVPVKPRSSLQITSPVILYKPNEFGIRGLNGSIGEWGMPSADPSPGEKRGGDKELVVLGGVLNRPRDDSSIPSTVNRHPWEAFTTVGFRCASVTGENG